MGVNVLALFDGISCGRVALNRCNFHVGRYYSSEIDKYAIKVSKSNWPDIVQKGDILNWRQWDIDWGNINLVIGGSPCQGFSFSGKQLAFEDPRSKLFFTFVEILNHVKSVNPNVKFLLENVRMKKEYLKIISSFLKCEPVFINSNLLTAQNRPRYYWANWDFEVPEDRGIFLNDILQKDVDEKYMISESYMKRLLLSEDLKKRFSAINPEKALCMTARQYANWKETLVASLTERRTELSKKIRAKSLKETGRDFSPRRGKEIVARSDGKSNCLTATFSMAEHTLIDGYQNYRKLTPVECERLQNLPDGYTRFVSDAQAYKQLGNGWDTATVQHIFEGLKS